MENNEIMNNEELMENGIELVQAEVFKPGKGLIITAAVGATVLGGILIYKKVIKPAIAKAKANRAASAECEGCTRGNGIEVESNDND